MNTVLVLGAGGLIGASVASALPSGHVTGLRHTATFEHAAFDGVDVVLFAGRDPKLGTPTFNLESTAEIVAAQIAADQGIHFISLGTGRVYAPSDGPWSEASPIGPDNRYGQDKLALENRLLEILGSSLTRLRIANVFGFEPGHQTFMGQMLQSLGDDQTIRFDMSPFTRRDFLPVDILGGWIAKLCLDPPGGVLNIGSGIALDCGRLALWVIEGYGRGELRITDPTITAEFVMDIARLQRLVNTSINIETLRTSAINLGAQLKLSGA